MLIILFPFLMRTSLSNADTFCGDEECKKIQNLYHQSQYDKIVEMASIKKKYSEGAVFFIGRACINLSDRSNLTSNQKEKLLLTAIEYGYYPAYMNLYNIYADKDAEVAIGFVKKYVEKNPDDPDPFFIIGESEFKKNNYKLANTFLKKSKKLSKGHTATLDWLLFKVNYILRDYGYSKKMLDSAFAQGHYVEELRALKADSRFADIEKHAEFEKYLYYFKR